MGVPAQATGTSSLPPGCPSETLPGYLAHPPRSPLLLSCHLRLGRPLAGAKLLRESKEGGTPRLREEEP